MASMNVAGDAARQIGGGNLHPRFFNTALAALVSLSVNQLAHGALDRDDKSCAVQHCLNNQIR